MGAKSQQVTNSKRDQVRSRAIEIFFEMRPAYDREDPHVMIEPECGCADCQAWDSSFDKARRSA